MGPSQGFNNSLTKYFYDTHYQLLRTDYPNVAPFNSEINSWTYDLIGNRLTNTVNGATQNYTYFKNGANPLNGQRLQSDSVNSYTYDLNGNMITKTGSTFTWDPENRLTGITGAATATYVYDYSGRRGSKTVSGATTTYIYDGQNLIGERGSSVADFLFGPGIDEPLAMRRSAATYYYNADGLGSVGAINNSAGTVQDKYIYDAWGIVKSQTTPVANSFTYTAREVGEAGLMYYRARQSLPSIGRFVSEDPLPSIQLFSDDSYNERPDLEAHRYVYVVNSPLYFTDPNGLHANPPTAHPKCTSCPGGNPPDIDNAAGRACDVISTPGCQRALGTNASCVTDLCRNVKPQIVCNEPPWCNDPKNRGMSPPGPPNRIVICTNHPDNGPGKDRGKAITIFHELLHKCIGKGGGKHVGRWRKKYTIPCFGTAKS